MNKPSDKDRTTPLENRELLIPRHQSRDNTTRHHLFRKKREKYTDSRQKDRELTDLEIPGVTGVKLTARGAIVEDHIMKLNLVVDASPLTVNVTFYGDTITESVDTKINLIIEGDAVATQPIIQKTSSIYIFKIWETATASQLKLTPKIELPKGATLDSIVVRYSDGLNPYSKKVNPLISPKLKEKNTT